MSKDKNKKVATEKKKPQHTLKEKRQMKKEKAGSSQVFQASSHSA